VIIINKKSAVRSLQFLITGESSWPIREQKPLQRFLKEDRNDFHISVDPDSYKSRGDIHHSECGSRRGQFPLLELDPVKGAADIFHLYHRTCQRLVFEHLFPVSESEEGVVR